MCKAAALCCLHHGGFLYCGCCLDFTGGPETEDRCLSSYTRGCLGKTRTNSQNQRLTAKADRITDHVTPRKRVAVGSGSGTHTDVDRPMTNQIRRTGSGPKAATTCDCETFEFALHLVVKRRQWVMTFVTFQRGNQMFLAMMWWFAS